MSDLLSQISSAEKIRRSWAKVRRNWSASSGLDNISVLEYEGNLDKNLQEIQVQLRNKTYSFKPSIEKPIPKKQGGERKIHIFTIRDKVVQQALQSLFLQDRAEGSFFPDLKNKISVAYLPKVNGVALSVKYVKQHYRKGLSYVSVLDIQDFFDHIPGDKLFQDIKSHLPDRSIDWLIERTITQSVYRHHQVDPLTGVLQGSVLAPLYSNIYLAKFDRRVEMENISAIRYADDMAIFSYSSEQAILTCKKIRILLKTLTGLEFYSDNHPLKAPKHVCVNDRPAEYLGIKYYLGVRKNLMVGPADSKVKAVKEKITSRFSNELNYSIAESIVSINQSILGWQRHYITAKCHGSPLNKALSEIKNHYMNVVQESLKNIKIIHSGQHLSNFQASALGIMSVKSINRRKRRI
jgi:RNA-directed DNA polymerase